MLQSDEQQDSWLGLLKAMRGTLKGKKFSQIPQLSTSRQIDVMDPFTLKNTNVSRVMSRVESCRVVSSHA